MSKNYRICIRPADNRNDMIRLQDKEGVIKEYFTEITYGSFYAENCDLR